MKRPRTAARAAGLDKTLLRQIADLADSSCVDLGLGELVFPTPRAVLDGVSEAIGRWPLGYTANAGLPELRARIAARTGPDVDPDRVCVTSGSEEALFLSLAVLVDPGDEVLVPDPGFPAYPKIVRLWGGVPVYYPLDRGDGFALRSRRLESLVTEKTKAVILNSPNNPTGAVYAGDEFDRLAAALAERGVVPISDEVYREIYYGKTRPESIRTRLPEAIVVDSLSKSFAMTGWRLGWCVVPPGLAKPVIAIHQMAVTCASVPAQRATLIAFDGGADDERQKNLGELRRRRDLAVRCLKNDLGLPFAEPEGAFYVFVDVSSWRADRGTSLDIAAALAVRSKVIAIPGIAFGPGGEGFLRLSFAGDPEDFAEGVRRIASFGPTSRA
ncbi:MAG: aminotransferase class I/II-fold pyridoxal phosphate-dependent enzyme [Candidatus Aminicenantes bacterium]|nr:aminotransferase class I/II-fold pyridoxal phosphate-dependent enzyme [Candidatus Aminicenantes bacterium]